MHKCRPPIHYANLIEHGFTYVGILILIAVIGLVSSATLKVGTLLQRREAEYELLAIGLEYRNALISYANATPQGQSIFPGSMQDLVKDPRYPNARRHLRRIYVDPITAKEEWGTVSAPDGTGIAGIHSLSNSKPIKVANFDANFPNFNEKSSYKDWVFTSR